jgi:UDP-N-acetylmuramyl pentapeptide phosphotransferase/UDP-N-acetylglucosamine-1-phosphate transferase
MDSAFPSAVVAPITALVVGFLLTWFLRSRFAPRLVLDIPNERSLHTRPVPRTGGIGVLAGIAAGVAFLPEYRTILVWLIPLFLVSALDDVRGMPAAMRLAVHLGVAIAFVHYAAPDFTDFGHAAFRWFAVLVLGVAIAWMTNLYNFMDGSDGLAGGMAAIGFGAYGVAAWIQGDPEFARLAWCVAGAAAGFLVFNFSPASIFLGDTGSIPLGFLAGALGLLGVLREAWPWWFPAVIFAPFIVDATLTLLRRMLRREQVWQAHRDHYYQRLVRMGWSHRRTALAEYALMLGCAIAAILAAAVQTFVGVAALGLAGIALLAILHLVDAKWAKPGDE